MNAMPADPGQTRSPSKYDRLIAAAQAVPPVPTIVVHPCDETSLRGVVDSAAAGIIRPVLVGPEKKIRAAAAQEGVDLAPYEIVSTEHSHAAAAKAVELARAGDVDALMKGSLHTDELMGAVVSATSGLRTARRMSHVFVIDVPTYPRLLFVSDAYMTLPRENLDQETKTFVLDHFKQHGGRVN